MDRIKIKINQLSKIITNMLKTMMKRRKSAQVKRKKNNPRLCKDWVDFYSLDVEAQAKGDI
jgi:hypothetical protein